MNLRWWLIETLAGKDAVALNLRVHGWIEANPQQDTLVLNCWLDGRQDVAETAKGDLDWLPKRGKVTARIKLDQVKGRVQ